MALFTILHKCGHSAERQITGKESLRQGTADWFAGRDCPDCFKKAQQIERDKAAADAIAKAGDLITLEGSDKQVSWAIAIRAALIISAEEAIEKYGVKIAKARLEYRQKYAHSIAAMILAGDKTLEALKAEKSAKWWIDNRDLSWEGFIQLSCQSSLDWAAQLDRQTTSTTVVATPIPAAASPAVEPVEALLAAQIEQAERLWDAYRDLIEKTDPDAFYDERAAAWDCPQWLNLQSLIDQQETSLG